MKFIFIGLLFITSNSFAQSISSEDIRNIVFRSFSDADISFKVYFEMKPLVERDRNIPENYKFEFGSATGATRIAEGIYNINFEKHFVQYLNLEDKIIYGVYISLADNDVAQIVGGDAYRAIVDYTGSRGRRLGRYDAIQWFPPYDDLPRIIDLIILEVDDSVVIISFIAFI